MNSLTYSFRLANGAEKNIHVELDPSTLALVLPKTDVKPPAWARLEFRQCICCPLDPAQHQYCPVARNVAALVAEFGELVSRSSAEISVVTDERTTVKNAPLGDGLYSLMGIYMATSGCPIMDKLKPMAATHLPFATMEETVYRVVTMYCAAQYFRMKNGKAPDWAMEKLARLYENIRAVNVSFKARLREAAKQDAVIHSLMSLDAFARVMSDADTGAQSLEYMFRPFMAD